MPSRKVIIERGGVVRPKAPKGAIATTYETLMSPENRAVVTGIAAFGVAVSFLSSSWAEFFLVPQ